jgi:hypothetical protein
MMRFHDALTWASITAPVGVLLGHVEITFAIATVVASL